MGRKRLTVAVAEELKKVLFTPTGKGRGKERKKVARSGGKKGVKEVDSEGRGSGAGVGFLKLSTGAENFSAVEGEIVDNLSTLTEKISAVKPEIVDNLKYWVLVNMALNQSVFGKTSTVVILFTIINLYFLRGEVSVSQEELGKITGLTDRTVRDSLKSLKLRGFIEVNYRRNAKAGESYSYKPVFERILEVMGKGGMLGDGRFSDYLKVLGVPKLSTGAENFSAVEPKNVDNLSTLAEFFSSVNLKNVDNSLKYAYLTEVINNQSVFGSALGVALFLALLSLEFTRGVINVSQAELEAFTGISERSIRKILREFEDRGILAVDRRRNTKVGESLVYRILHRKIFPLCCSNIFNYININNYYYSAENFRWRKFPTEKISAVNLDSDDIIKGEGKFKSVRIDTLIMQYGKDRVYQVMDMLNNQYKDREIAHPYRLIKKVLDDPNFVHNKFYMQFRGKKVGEMVPIYIECPSCGHKGIVELKVGGEYKSPCSKCGAVVEVDLRV